MRTRLVRRTAIGAALILGLGICWSFSTATAADKPTTPDVLYKAGATTERNKLDVYAPPKDEKSTAKRPIMVWLHGGGWRRGDKLMVAGKPAAFTAKGFVFVSVNYRFVPDADYRAQGADVAAAIAWIRAHAADYQADPDRIFIGGHSAGAHLSALVSTDERYLKGEKLDLSCLKGTILVDGAAYDIPKQIAEAPGPLQKSLYTNAFGTDETKQRDASPFAHVAAGKSIPPFLILYVADRPDAKTQSEALAKALKDAGGAAELFSAANKNHATINRELGDAGDPPTVAMWSFLDKRLEGAPPVAAAK